MRTFDTGATRDLDDSKYDYEGFLSPLVVERFAAYMHKHRETPNGLRASDNWQKGIPRDAYMKSGWRHFFDWWKAHRGLPVQESIEDILCALLFNVQGYLHELLARRPTERSSLELLSDELIKRQAPVCRHGNPKGPQHACIRCDAENWR